MELTIKAESAEDLRFKVTSLAEQFGRGQVPAGAVPMMPSQYDGTQDLGQTAPVATAPKAAKTTAKKAAAVKPAAAIEPEIVADGPTPGEDTEDGAIGPEMPDKHKLTYALQAVNLKKGMKVAKELIASFGVTRLSELPDDKKLAFVEACKAAAK